MSAALLIFLLTYAVIAIGKIPGFRLDRPGAALLGASLMVGVGALSLQEAYAAIDLDTITLLFGMMIVVANLRLAGFFRLVGLQVVQRAQRPILLLVGIVLVAGVFSAFFVNDTICLILTPLVLDVVTRLRRKPTPYLLGVAMASNVGSTATITGNPQNMMIGSFSHLPYRAFAAALSPVAALGLVMTVALLWLFYRDEFHSSERLRAEEEKTRINRPLVGKALLVSAAMIVAFFLGQPAAKVALLAGAFLLLTRRLKPERVYREIDWSLLVLFVGLFVVVAGVEKTSIVEHVLAAGQKMHLENSWILSGVTAVLSNLVSNVPAVLMLKPFVVKLADQNKAWLILAMASTLAGNFTILGSVANLIVVQKARQQGHTITFWEYFRVGAPLSLLTIAMGAWWLH